MKKIVQVSGRRLTYFLPSGKHYSFFIFLHNLKLISYELQIVGKNRVDGI